MIERTTSTGKVLRLLEPGVDSPELDDAGKDEMLECMSKVLSDAEEEKIIGLVVLAIPASGIGMEFYSTGMALGDLLILRDRFEEVIEDVQHPDTQ